MKENQRFVKLLEMLKSKGIVANDADFAKRLEISRSVISDIRNEKKPISNKILIKANKEFGISVEFINKGTGPEFEESKDIEENASYDRSLMQEALLRTILYQVADVKAHLLQLDPDAVLKEINEDSLEVLNSLVSKAKRK